MPTLLRLNDEVRFMLVQLIKVLGGYGNYRTNGLCVHICSNTPYPYTSCDLFGFGFTFELYPNLSLNITTFFPLGLGTLVLQCT